MAEIEVFRARNTTGLAINGTRVTETKPYGLIQTTQKFKADDEEITKALRIDVQPVKQGRWIADNRDCRGYADCFTCTHCKAWVYTNTLMKNCDYDYCPNCGARMDGDTK